MKNIQLTSLVQALKKKSVEEKAALWHRIAEDLERPTRLRRVVNLSRINNYVTDNETVIVPGKVLGTGDITRKCTIAAYTYSDQAREKLLKAGCNAMSIEEFMAKNKTAKNIKVLG